MEQWYTAHPCIRIFICLCLYCKDPDTGKLHAVNTTWPSQTFCGNYTCKLRKRNNTETQYTPLQKINISAYKTHQEHDDMHISPSDNSIAITKITTNDKQPVFHKGFLENKQKLIFNDKDNDSDRYLTESEIKTITDMLYTVKKSDLEAIIDIYNLAQDIYKEIDSVNMKKLVKETIKVGESESSGKENSHSYWYEPIQYHNKHVEMKEPVHEGTNVISTKKPSPRIDSNPTFFKGPLTTKDFGKLPYYYPISNFQRLSSYVHTKPNVLQNTPTEKQPCNNPVNSNNYVPWYGKTARNSGLQATVPPPTLLPYPFSYIYHYNISGYPSSYYYNYPWTQTGYARHPSYSQSHYGPYIAKIPSYTYNRASTSPEEESSESKSPSSDFLEKLMKAPTEKKTLPDWQTEPLSEKVLEEVRAHVVDKPRPLKSMTLKKNVKLERVGKVIKLDELARTKRELINYVQAQDNGSKENEFEAYIERTTCENNTEPGYFSIGNMSQPFPDCCPQKIERLHLKREAINVNN